MCTDFALQRRASSLSYSVSVGSRELTEMKILTVIKVEQRHFFLLFLALFLDRLGRGFRLSRLEGDERKSDMKRRRF